MKKSFLPFILLGVFLLAPVFVYAQDTGLVQCGPQQDTWCELKDLFGLIVRIYNFLLGMAGIVAFGFLIYGGVQMFLFSVDEEHLKNGKSTVIQALIGLSVVALAYIIVNTLLIALGITTGRTQPDFT